MMGFSNSINIKTEPLEVQYEKEIPLMLWDPPVPVSLLTIRCQAVDSQQNPALCYWLDAFHAENKHAHTAIHYSSHALVST
jgi:hypothetical protein